MVRVRHRDVNQMVAISVDDHGVVVLDAAFDIAVCPMHMPMQVIGGQKLLQQHPVAQKAFVESVLAVAQPEAVNIGLVVGTTGALLVDTGSSPRQGADIRAAAQAVAGDVPLMIEHMQGPEEYDRSRARLLEVAKEVGVSFG